MSDRDWWGTLRYADEDQKLRVALIASFRRGCIEMAGYPQMSNSSGPKDYLKNRIFALLEIPHAEEVYLVRGRGPVFAIIRFTSGQLADIEGRRVVLEQ